MSFGFRALGFSFLSEEEIIERRQKPDFMHRKQRLGDIAPRFYFLPVDRLRHSRRPVELTAGMKVDEPSPNIRIGTRFVVEFVKFSVTILRGEALGRDFIPPRNRGPDSRFGEV